MPPAGVWRFCVVSRLCERECLTRVRCRGSAIVRGSDTHVQSAPRNDIPDGTQFVLRRCPAALSRDAAPRRCLETLSRDAVPRRCLSTLGCDALQGKQPRSGAIYVAQGVSLGNLNRKPASRGAATSTGRVRRSIDAAAPRLFTHDNQFPNADALGYVDCAAPRRLRRQDAAKGGRMPPDQPLEGGAPAACRCRPPGPGGTVTIPVSLRASA